MKKTLLALSLIGCMLFATVSCTTDENPEGDSSDPKTSDTVTVEQQKPGNDDQNKPGNNNNDNKGGSIQNGGVDTDDRFGPLHPVK